ncbi:CU044_2847 family protein [Streptomyces antimicrobicus]|uniref:Trypsin-co-occurring domain-containing protein n=1 Tax=Streptomyces antimicrobicus TaxID=2883108 RepID=A0ABS8BDJ9_9ACTN|nr:CU044_2847 family protein [Streptomyces antimicrobicus]MCB5182719.1 hypothetical protein [Streptomyces antimicrobicus]
MAEVVSYALDDGTVVRFEAEPTGNWHPVSSEDVAGRVRDAAGPAVEAARTVLHRIAELRPDQVEVKFGLKVNGTANWIVAKAATEANFEITLSWEPRQDTDGPAPQG